MITGSIYVLFLLALIESGVSEATDFETYEFYPCIDVHSVLETFSYSTPRSYNVTVFVSKLENFTEKWSIKLKFDALSNTTYNFKASSFYDDGYSLDVNAILNNNIRPSFRVSPYRGNPIPNLISVKINKQEVCNNGVHKDIWINFLNVTDQPIVDVPSPMPKANKILPDCGRRPVQNRPFIVHGSTSKPGDWPWHSALYKLHTSSSQLQYICGGTLISSTRVLTAGHCVIEYGSILLPERLFVALGKFNFIGDDNGLQEKRVFEIVLHPRFSRTNLTNDIAILKLSSKVTFTEFIQPICFDAENYPEKSQLAESFGYVVGWGMTEKAKYSEQLMESHVPIKSDLECIKEDPSFFGVYLNDGNFCVGYENGTSVCNGDSGGGLYLSQNGSEGHQVWFLRGIVSLGAPLHDQFVCNPEHFTLFTDVAHYVDFIEKHI